MNEERTPVWLATTHEVIAREELVGWLTKNRSLTGDPAYLVDLRIEKAIFEALPSDGSISSFRAPVTTAGRIFGPKAEIRWAMRDAHFDVWTIQETAEGSANLGQLRAHSIRYYCLGRWKPKKHRYVEGYLSVELDYPLHGTQEDDRFYVKAFEYLVEPTYYAPTSPDGADANTNDSVLKQIVAALNRPRVVAVRFSGVGAGRTS